MDTTSFDREVADLAAALGDATRRGIFITVREAAEPVTASEIARLFHIHPNVARHHLDRLVADGYLQVTRRRPGKRRGPGAGRPAKHYEATRKAVSVQFPIRRYDLLVDLLVRVIERLAPGDAGALAEEVGQEYGREIAAELDLAAGDEPIAVAVARALTGMGFDTTPGDGDVLVTRHCPFGEAATSHPELVCRLDQGIVRGLLKTARGETVAVVTPHGSLDDPCLTEL